MNNLPLQWLSERVSVSSDSQSQSYREKREWWNAKQWKSHVVSCSYAAQKLFSSELCQFLNISTSWGASITLLERHTCTLCTYMCLSDAIYDWLMNNWLSSNFLHQKHANWRCTWLIVSHPPADTHLLLTSNHTGFSLMLKPTEFGPSGVCWVNWDWGIIWKMTGMEGSPFIWSFIHGYMHSATMLKSPEHKPKTA